MLSYLAKVYGFGRKPRQFATQKDQVVTIKAAQRFKADVVSKDRTASIIYALCDRSSRCSRFFWRKR